MRYKIGVIGLKGLPAFGGAATVGENIINELKNEYQFTVYAVSSHTSHEGQQEGYYQIVFKKFFFKKFNIFFYYLKSAFHSLFRAKYDIIHIHHTDGAIIIPLLRLKYPVIITSHAQPQINDKWPGMVKLFFRISEKIALRFANKITAVSILLVRTYQQMTSRKIYYIPNGINLNQKISKEPVIKEDYIMFSAGRIIPLKGLHILLQAMHHIELNQKLLVIGDLEQMPSYKEEILRLSEGINIEFIPLIKEKPVLLNYVKHAIFFVFPSYNENMSLMLLEAAFTKTPLICSDIPANTDIFNEDEVLFFKTNDIDDLSKKIIFAFGNPEVLKTKANKAYCKVEVDYNWIKIAGLYTALYNELILRNY